MMWHILTWDIPKCLWLSSNDTLSRYPKAGRIKALRAMAALTARTQIPFTLGSVSEAAVSVGYPTDGRADPPNAWPTVKALMDGVVDAGILVDDDDLHVGKMSFTRGPKTGAAGVHTIRVELIQ